VPGDLLRAISLESVKGGGVLVLRLDDKRKGLRVAFKTWSFLHQEFRRPIHTGAKTCLLRPD
jgi:hypothetical protein